MRVGILTFHSSYNFGANLQALATQSVVQKLGADACLLDFQNPAKMEFYGRITRPDQVAAHEEFYARYFRLSPRLTTARELREYCLDALDAVIIGSDAVFRIIPKLSLRRILRRLLRRSSGFEQSETIDELPVFWGDWLNGDAGRRLSRGSVAASSEGTKYYCLAPSLYPRLWKAARGFDVLTVRDRWTQGMVSLLTLGTRRPELCPDPVFALNDAFPIPESEGPPVDVRKTILMTGNLDSAWRRAFVDAAHRRGFQVANLPNPDRDFAFPEADFHLPLPLSPLQWFNTLRRAAGFIGIRFHAAVSCITNKTPVITLDSAARFDLGHRSRSKNFDLMRNAGVPGRYETTWSVTRHQPERLLDRLFEPAAQARADAYADQAPALFQKVVSRVLASSNPAAA